MSIIYPGAQVVESVTCTLDDALTDPTALTVRILPKDGTEVTYTWPDDAEVVHDSLGVFHVNITITNYPGVWAVRWEATGAVVAANEDAFRVSPSAFSDP